LGSTHDPTSGTSVRTRRRQLFSSFLEVHTTRVGRGVFGQLG
jgi:hypothetical protein